MKPHTPGPWAFNVETNTVEDSERVPVCTLPTLEAESSYEQTILADAALIAAAPKMLETLKAVVEFLEPQACTDCACEGSNPACNMLNEIEQAIAEAEGQS